MPAALKEKEGGGSYLYTAAILGGWNAGKLSLYLENWKLQGGGNHFLDTFGFEMSAG